MRKKNTIIRGLFTFLLAGGTVVGINCSDITSQSIKSGILNYISGSVGSNLNALQFGDFINNFFTGGFVGDSNNNSDS